MNSKRAMIHTYTETPPLPPRAETIKSSVVEKKRRVDNKEVDLHTRPLTSCALAESLPLLEIVGGAPPGGGRGQWRDGRSNFRGAAMRGGDEGGVGRRRRRRPAAAASDSEPDRWLRHQHHGTLLHHRIPISR